MNGELNRLLARQLRKTGLSVDAAPDPGQWRSFLDKLNTHYEQTDADRRRLTRSLQATTDESRSQVEALEVQQRSVEGLLAGLVGAMETFQRALSSGADADACGAEILHVRTSVLEKIRALVQDSRSATSVGSSLERQLTDLDHRLAEFSTRIAQLVLELAQSADVERELEVASAVQRLLLPSSDVIERPFAQVAAHYQPASACGGDWWTAQDLPDGRFLIVVGDVTGHGVSSSIITGAAKAACDLALTFHQRNFQAQDLLRFMNVAIRNAGRERYLMTAVVAILDPHRLTLTTANAGHAPALVVRNGETGYTSRAVAAHGAPLGSTFEPVFRPLELELQRGDSILWYTDGLTECENQQRQPFGEQRLRALLENSAAWTAEGIRDSIRHALGRYMTGTTQRDDVSFVVARLL